jgi:DNA repair exonuclease SbcCD nuclease subunit
MLGKRALFFDKKTIFDYIRSKGYKKGREVGSIDRELLIALLLSESFMGTAIDYDYIIGLPIKDSKISKFQNLHRGSMQDIQKIISDRKLIETDSLTDVLLGIVPDRIESLPPPITPTIKSIDLQIKRYISLQEKGKDDTENFYKFLDKYRDYPADKKQWLVINLEGRGNINLKNIEAQYNKPEYPFGKIIIVSSSNDKLLFIQIKPNPSMAEFNVSLIINKIINSKINI